MSCQPLDYNEASMRYFNRSALSPPNRERATEGLSCLRVQRDLASARLDHRSCRFVLNS
jgi:hypothetical protein